MIRICLLLLLSLTMSLAGCGGGQEQEATTTAGVAAASATDQPEIFRRALSATPVNDQALSATLVKVSETRVSRTVFDYQFKVQLKNASDIFYSDVGVVVSGNPNGTTILDAQATIGESAAGATVLSGDTVTIRHDRSFAFSPESLQFAFMGAVATTTVVVPQLGGSLAASSRVEQVASPFASGPVGSSVQIWLSEGKAPEGLFLALDSQGEAIGLAYSRAAPQISARSTALALVRIAADVYPVAAGETQPDQLVAISPLFAELVAAVDAVYQDRDRSLTDATLIDLVWAVAEERRTALQEWWSAVSASEQQKRVLGVTSVPYWFWQNDGANAFGLDDIQSSPNVVALNRTFNYWTVKATDRMTGGVLARVVAPPNQSNAWRYIGIYTPSRTEIQGSRHFDFEVFQDDKSRLASFQQYIANTVTAIVRAYVFVPEAESLRALSCASDIALTLSRTNEFALYVATGDPEALKALGEKALQTIALRQLTLCVSSDWNLKGLLDFIAQFKTPAGKLINVIKFTDSTHASLSGIYQILHPHAPVNEAVCQSAAGDVIPCGFTLQILGAPATLKVGETAKIFGQLLDSTGKQWPITKDAIWSLSGDALSIEDQGVENGLAYATIKANKAGSSEVTARVPSALASRSAVVSVETPASIGDFVANILWFQAAPCGSNLSVSFTLVGPVNRSAQLSGTTMGCLLPNAISGYLRNFANNGKDGPDSYESTMPHLPRGTYQMTVQWAVSPGRQGSMSVAQASVVVSLERYTNNAYSGGYFGQRFRGAGSTFVTTLVVP